MSDRYAEGFIDGWEQAVTTLRTRFDLTPRKPAIGPRVDAERLGAVGGHSDPPEGKPWLVGPQEPLRRRDFLRHALDLGWYASAGGDNTADCNGCTLHLIVGGACKHCGWEMP